VSGIKRNTYDRGNAFGKEMDGIRENLIEKSNEFCYLTRRCLKKNQLHNKELIFKYGFSDTKKK